MSKSVETVLEKGTDLMDDLMFADADFKVTFPAQKIDALVDTLYEYLSDPDQGEIAMMQMQLAPLAALAAQAPLQQKMTVQNHVPETVKPVITSFMKDMAEHGAKIPTPRMAEAFKRVSGMTLEENAAISAARLEHALETDSLQDLMTMNNNSSQKMVAETLQGTIGFLTSDKLLPFMQTLATKLDKEELKETLKYVAIQGLTVKQSFESSLDGIEEALMEKFGDREPTDLEIEAYISNEAGSKILTPLFQAITPTETGAQRAKRFMAAIEESLLESGAVTEERYNKWLESNNERTLKTMRGYDAMNGFDAKAALKRSKLKIVK